MTDLRKQKQGAIEVIARRLSATWEKGSDPSETSIKVGRKRVAVDIEALKGHGAGQENSAKPRLRFDRVVTRLMERLQATVGETVPDGMTVLLTITAPIRLASKTAAALEGKIQSILRRGSARRDEKDTIHGNRVRIRVLKNGLEQAPKIIGFVHNPETDPFLLLNLTCELLELLGGGAGRRARRLGPESADDRWLVVISARKSSCLEAYRYIYSQLPVASDFKKVLMMFGDGRVETLTE